MRSKRKIKSNDNSTVSSMPKNMRQSTCSFKTKSVQFFTKQILTLRILYDRTHFQLISYLLLFVEIFINLFIINRVKYTEIDWSTYMQQVESFLNGTLDYQNICGDTGPIVYPAGHLYIYTLLYYLTNRGTNIYFAQHIFIVLYIATLFVVFKLYEYSKVPPYVLIFMCCTSYRVHSIYVLRLFNDPFAMFFLYLALLWFAKKRWFLGFIFYSLAVSIKMNILLFAPAIFLVYMESYTTIIDMFQNLFVCISIQLALAIPFLLTYPLSYIKSSFNVGRVFMHKWTVNYRFLPEEYFTSRYFHIGLLSLHVAFLLIIFRKRWLGLVCKLLSPQTKSFPSNGPNSESILFTVFTANFIGLVFSRSLHYQFYVWYYHSLPFLLWSTQFQTRTKICILGFIELVWNIYPSTVWSSALLHMLHLPILVALFGNNFSNGRNVDKLK